MNFVRGITKIKDITKILLTNSILNNLLQTENGDVYIVTEKGIKPITDLDDIVVTNIQPDNPLPAGVSSASVNFIVSPSTRIISIWGEITSTSSSPNLSTITFSELDEKLSTFIGEVDWWATNSSIGTSPFMSVLLNSNGLRFGTNSFGGTTATPVTIPFDNMKILPKG